ncbi:hypothetical protein [Massilia mucilaginosa]|nr:hypothetical protein [Massilia mucilaginosa]
MSASILMVYPPLAKVNRDGCPAYPVPPLLVQVDPAAARHIEDHIAPA